MRTYDQATGSLSEPSDTGYSGRGEGLNNPDMEDVHDVGPIPRGTWTLGQARTDDRLGPVAIPLVWVLGPNGETAPPNGRFGFYIHGDTQARNNTASNGCIILGRATREALRDSPDRDLEVI